MFGLLSEQIKEADLGIAFLVCAFDDGMHMFTVQDPGRVIDQKDRWGIGRLDPASISRWAHWHPSIPRMGTCDAWSFPSRSFYAVAHRDHGLLADFDHPASGSIEIDDHQDDEADDERNCEGM